MRNMFFFVLNWIDLQDRLLLLTSQQQQQQQQQNMPSMFAGPSRYLLIPPCSTEVEGLQFSSELSCQVDSYILNYKNWSWNKELDCLGQERNRWETGTITFLT